MIRRRVGGRPERDSRSTTGSGHAQHHDVTEDPAVATARVARLFDKLVGSGGGFEINNSLPLDNDPEPTVKAKQVDTHAIWSSRQAAQNGNSKGARA